MANSSHTLSFHKIEYSTIFNETFTNFKRNNELKFSSGQHIVVVYAPNGTGKTSLSRVFERSKDTAYEATYNNVKVENSSFFHVIHDQNNRNIIEGKAEDFLIGDNITKETELKDTIQSEITDYYNICKKILHQYSITTKSSRLFSFYKQPFRAIIETIINNKNHGTEYWKDIPHLYTALDKNCISDAEFSEYVNKEEEIQYFAKEYSNKDSLLNQYLNVNLSEIVAVNNSHEIVECNDALKILQKYPNKHNCIVCDNEIDQTQLLQLKTQRKDIILSKISPKLRDRLLPLLDLDKEDDLFKISEHLLNFLDAPDTDILDAHKASIIEYGNIIAKITQYNMRKEISTTNLEDSYIKLKNIIESRIEIDDQDILFLKQNVESSMNKKLSFEHDASNGNIVIKLDNGPVIEEDRSKLPLSTGEQNFISLAFELLKAKKLKCPVTVLDDPISSFDSIYRYKITYLILSALSEAGNVIIFTHNTDLIRLLEIQQKNSFSLYIFNNSIGGNNGFIPVNTNEKNLVIFFERMPELLRNPNFCQECIRDYRLFLMSLTPYMRSYSNFIGKHQIKDEITKVMHGYNNEKIDIYSYYEELFSNKESCLFDEKIAAFSAEDIIHTKILPDTEIINNAKYPLLNKALAHSLIFLRLRLLTEQKLTAKYHINTRKNSQLGQIIMKAYPNNTNHLRMYFMSKKSLLNEFNHFEGNPNFFQPALDISDEILKKEQDDIENIFENGQY